jgi:surface protein
MHFVGLRNKRTFKGTFGLGTMMNPGGTVITNVKTNLYNEYKPGGGVGASSVSNRRAKNRFATICESGSCFKCYSDLGLYSHNKNGFIECIPFMPSPIPPPSSCSLEYSFIYTGSEPLTEEIVIQNIPVINVDETYILSITVTIRGTLVRVCINYTNTIRSVKASAKAVTNDGMSFANVYNWYNDNTSALTIIRMNIPLSVGGSQFYGLLDLTFASGSGDPIILENTSLDNAFYNATNFNGDVSGWDTSTVINMDSMFYNADAFNQYIGGWDTSLVTNMDNMFNNAALFNQDISGWNTSSVESMVGMFTDAASFAQDISGWVMSSVTNMNFMFYNATTFNEDISGWDTSQVVNMNGMFSGATIFNQNIGGWDVSKVALMVGMFFNAAAFNQDISGWDTSSVVNMDSMFSGASSFNQDIGGWDTTLVINMNGMFLNASAFNNGDVPDGIDKHMLWDVSYFVGVTPINFSPGSSLTLAPTGNSPFDTNGAPALSGNFVYTFTYVGVDVLDEALVTTYIPIINADSSFTTLTPTITIVSSDVTVDIAYVFVDNGTTYDGISFNDVCDWYYNDTSLLTITNLVAPLSRGGYQFTNLYDLVFDVGAGNPVILLNTSLAHCFENANTYDCLFNSDISGWDTSEVIDMSFTFGELALFDQPLNTWNTSKVTTMENTFNDCYIFNQPLNNWDTSKVTTMLNMFGFTEYFNQDISGWDTGSVVNMESMFSGALVFNQPLDSWDTSQVVSMEYMFNAAANFNQPLNSWNTSAVVEMGYMFEQATLFNQDLSNWDTSQVTNMGNMFTFATVFNNGDAPGGTSKPMNWNVSYFGGITPNTFSYGTLLTLAPTGNSPFTTDGL